MDAVVQALEQLEAERAQLHDALRVAAFALIEAQRAAESRGGLVDYAVLPDASRQPRRALVWLSPSATDKKEDEQTHAAAIHHSDSSSSDLATIQSWTMHFSDGVAPPSSSSEMMLHKHGAVHAATSEDTATSDADDTTAPIDVLYCFGATPSRELRACRAHYRAVLRCVLATAQAQAAALAAAATAAAAEEATEQR